MGSSWHILGAALDPAGVQMTQNAGKTIQSVPKGSWTTKIIDCLRVLALLLHYSCVCFVNFCITFSIEKTVGILLNFWPLSRSGTSLRDHVFYYRNTIGFNTFSLFGILVLLMDFMFFIGVVFGMLYPKVFAKCNYFTFPAHCLLLR